MTLHAPYAHSTTLFENRFPAKRRLLSRLLRAFCYFEELLQTGSNLLDSSVPFNVLEGVIGDGLVLHWEATEYQRFGWLMLSNP